MKRRKKVSRGALRLVEGGKPAKAPDLVKGDVQRMLTVCQHFERWIGPVAQVMHETQSEIVHVDVHVIMPRPERPYITLFTTGMSELPMKTPCTCCPNRLELMMTLPADWPLPAPSCECCAGKVSPHLPRSEPRLWPVTCLRYLARYPHRTGKWLGFGHTVQNGHPPERFAPDAAFCCSLILSPLSIPPEALELAGPDGETIEILAPYPIYRPEMQLKLRRGTPALLARLERAGVTDLVDTRRPDSVTGKCYPEKPDGRSRKPRRRA
jgi:hypothetical protein